ncbi:hypothetical protein ACLBQW_14070, partial [Klebsiella pneumoniae]
EQLGWRGMFVIGAAPVLLTAGGRMQIWVTTSDEGVER